jgi:hypothetical protein
MKNFYYIYWHQAGKHQADYVRLCDELIPSMGAADTVAGEMLRSATRLAYDLYNNGMGNNTSGAVNYLLRKGVIDKDTHRTIYEYTRGQQYDGHYEGDALQVAIEKTIDATVELILAHPTLATTANTEDQFEFEDAEQHWCDDCGDEMDGRGYINSVCQHCEDAYYEEEEYEY